MAEELLASDLVLASASPRRADILRELGVDFYAAPANIDESVRAGEAPAAFVRRIALEKGETIASAIERSRPVLAADTAVVIDGNIMGKPKDASQARDMLQQLSGRWHEVFTGVALVHRAVETLYVRTKVKFRSLDDSEAKAYWASGEPADKAGAYAIQGLGGAFVERIDGSYSNVVGLPMVETLALLRRFQVAHRLSP